MERAAIPEVRKSAEDSFASGFYCAESVVMAIAKAEGVDSGLLPRIATGFGGGMARTCGDCGALTGAVMAVGLALGRSTTTESVEPTFAATQRLIADFEREFGARGCQALLDGCDLGAPEGQAMFNEQKLRRRCLRFTGGAAEIAARVIAEARG
jgi:C_GCAxxG_C_C family probable redox protein